MNSAEFRHKFRVFQIVSYQSNYIYKGSQTHGGVFWTIWNCLESVLTLLKKFRGITAKIPCFPENLVTGKISLRIRYDSYIGILRPFGTIIKVFEKKFRGMFR